MPVSSLKHHSSVNSVHPRTARTKVAFEFNNILFILIFSIFIIQLNLMKKYELPAC